MGGFSSVPFVTCTIGVCSSHGLSVYFKQPSWSCTLETQARQENTSNSTPSFLVHRPQTDALATFCVQIQHCLGHLKYLNRLYCCQLWRVITRRIKAPFEWVNLKRKRVLCVFSWKPTSAIVLMYVTKHLREITQEKRLASYTLDASTVFPSKNLL